MQLEGKVAIVTGASSGIGRAIARHFSAEGAQVVVADVTEEPLEGGEPTIELIEREGGTATFLTTDVSDKDAIDALVSKTVERYQQLDVMVNNAAIFTGKNLLDTDEAEWDAVMAVNVRGVFLGCQRAVKQMLMQPIRHECRGRIVNISSQHGMISCPGDIAYGVSKSAIVYMTRQIAADYAKQNIVCNAVAPGKILTGRGGDAVSSEALAYSHSRTPLPRLGKPEDVAKAVAYLASDACSYTTGVNLLVDGGWMAA